LGNTIKCIECGADVPSDAKTLGLCPRCMLARVIDARHQVPPSGYGGPGHLRPVHDAQYHLADLGRALRQFDIQEMIGRGGMGIVYRALDRHNNRALALKILPIDQNQDVELLGRFISEARILTSLHHPNIVEAYESGQRSGFMYLAMELVQGQSLRDLLRQGPLSAESVKGITTQICDALSFAHERGIIHRDIKPENILLEEGMRVRLVDFGLARPFQELPRGASPTAPDQYVGTADYVAPELRYRHQPADARADIYSLGVVMYETLTGRLPIGHFPPPSSVAKSAKHLDKPILRCLATDPSARFASAVELRQALMKEHLSRVPLIAAAAAILAIILASICIYLFFRISSSPLFTSASLPATPQILSPQVQSAQMPAQSPPPQTSPLQALLPPPATTQPAPTPPPDQLVGQITNPFPPSGFTPSQLPPQQLPPSQLQPSTQFPPPFAPRIPFTPLGSRLIDRFGADHVVKVIIHGLTDANRKAALDELTRNGGHNFAASWSGAQCTAFVGPCDDVPALAKTIDFGTVTNVDTSGRAIEVDVPPPAGTQPSGNN
jgi:serine/threonine protein kinase